MTNEQQNVIAALAARKIIATIKDHGLNFRFNVKSGSKIKKQTGRFTFDNINTMDGACIVRCSLKGAYSDHIARVALYEIIGATQGAEAAAEFAAETRQLGLTGVEQTAGSSL